MQFYKIILSQYKAKSGIYNNFGDSRPGYIDRAWVIGDLHVILVSSKQHNYILVGHYDEQHHTF